VSVHHPPPPHDTSTRLFPSARTWFLDARRILCTNAREDYPSRCGRGGRVARASPARLMIGRKSYSGLPVDGRLLKRSLCPSVPRHVSGVYIYIYFFIPPSRQRRHFVYIRSVRRANRRSGKIWRKEYLDSGFPDVRTRRNS